MKYGIELIESLKEEIKVLRAAMEKRAERIKNWETDDDDCFISECVESRSISVNQEKINLIEDGGCAWFPEYATLKGEIVDAYWCNTKYGTSLRVVMPDGSVVWTTSNTKKGLAKRGLKKVECKRPAWFAFHSNGSGMYGVYTGSHTMFPSDINYATDELADDDPIEIRDIED